MALFIGVHHDEYFVDYRIYKYKHKEKTLLIFAKDSRSSTDSLFYMRDVWDTDDDGFREWIYNCLYSNSIARCINSFLQKKPTRFQTSGICLTVVGVIVCVTAKGFESSFSGIGYIMLCMAVLSYSLYCVSAEKADKTTSIEKTYVMIACGACFFATMAIARSIAAGTVVDLLMLPFQNTVFLFSIVYLGIVSSVISFVLFNISISSIGTNKASSFVGISTAVSVLAGVFILDEKFSAMQCYGTLIILLGVYIANMKSRFFWR